MPPRNHSNPAAHHGRPAGAALLLLLALLGFGAAARAQQWPSQQPPGAQAPNRALIPYPGSGGAAGTPGNPQALPVRPAGPDGARQQLKQLSPSQQQQLFAQDRDLQLRFQIGRAHV